MEAIVLTDDELKLLEKRFGLRVRQMGPWNSDGTFGYSSIPIAAVEKAAETLQNPDLTVAETRRRENSMWYGSTKNLLESIVRQLRTEAPQDDAEWQAKTDVVQACLAEMVEMSEPTVSPSKGATSRYVHRPVADKLNRAMPHVRSMLTAMQQHDRTTALAHGETTLQRL
jgi:hypothetical protein